MQGRPAAARTPVGALLRSARQAAIANHCSGDRPSPERGRPGRGCLPAALARLSGDALHPVGSGRDGRAPVGCRRRHRFYGGRRTLICD
jgi:hypothetical protein